ncbi:unnamed protein product [Darwinula stevensoni]|uniref:Uncharacterized protein n=1 Tax=Darwinula stevensoni TaxID=69355 RepID=A0A7R9A001_9CRUS|nr:unnamed protein product [Darwinula stevensoni]CAG0884552.1 unnamed protein product [Darwinula stevensoni]
MSDRKDVVVFKTPNLPAPKKRRKVLDEDEYVLALENIIEHDFFPDLNNLKVQAQYLVALENNDTVTLRSLYERYTSGRPDTSSTGKQGCPASPATFETPEAPNRGEPESEKSIKKISHEKREDKSSCKEQKMQGLDAYLNSHTSEDNQSFSEIMEETEKRHRVKVSTGVEWKEPGAGEFLSQASGHPWLYKEEETLENSLVLPAIEDQADQASRPNQIDTWDYKNKNYIMYIPEGAPWTKEEERERRQNQRSIVHRNTRLIKSLWKTGEQLVKGNQMQNIVEGKVGIDGKELAPAADAGPGIKGYSFVKTPSPAPGVDGTPLMTWGEVETTPYLLEGGGGSTPLLSTPTFKIPDTPSRERLGLQLAEAASRSLREKKKKALNLAKSSLKGTPGGGMALERLASMSPAAQHLATARLGIRLGTDKALRASYTPSPQRRLSGTPTPSPQRLTRKGQDHTPTIERSLTSTLGQAESRELTDNLLHLPKRAKASDFF